VIGMDTVVVYSSKYLSMAEMIRNLLRVEGFAAVVRARDPFGAFSPGPHLATFQPTPLSVYEVLVPSDQAGEAQRFVREMAEEKGE
jgi:hypothetical protein